MQEEQKRFEARLGDYADRVERGEIAVSHFLTPAERKRATVFCKVRGLEENRVLFWGGYPGAERTRLLILPDWLSSVPELLPPPDQDPALTLPDARSVWAVRIKGSGFRTLSHRDYLGAMLGLGLERDAIGDIALQNEHEAVVFCTEKVAGFLIETVEKIGSDTVRVRAYEPDETFTDGRRFRTISDTVASPRLDCVVAALTHLSREAAQTAIRTGTVEVDFEVCERTDFPITPPTELSVRGFGRFRLHPFDGETRKGRLRMVAEQYL